MDRSACGLDSIRNEFNSAVAISQEFLEAATNVAIRRPYDGLCQLIDKTTSYQLPKTEWFVPPEKHGIAATAGAFAGNVAEFWLINRALGCVPGFGPTCGKSTWRGEALKAGITGMLLELANPLAGEHDFAWRKLQSTVKATANFASYGAITGKFNELGVLGRIGRRGLTGDILVNGAAGVGGALVGETFSEALNGKLIRFHDAYREAQNGARFGIGMASLDHLLIKRTRVQIESPELLPGVAPRSPLSTEQWAVSAYDGRSLKSPLFSYLAETRPHLRPPKYAKLRENVMNESMPVDLGFEAWPPEQRPAVIAELRRLAKTELSSDANLDGMIDRLSNSAGLKNAMADYLTANVPLRNLEGQLREQLAKSPERHKYTLSELISRRYEMGPDALQIETPELGQLIEQCGRAEHAWRQRLQEVQPVLVNELTTVMNDLARGADLPRLEVHVMSKGRGLYNRNRMGLGVVGPDCGTLSPITADLAIHEFVHHQHGHLHDWRALLFEAKSQIYALGRKLELTDRIPVFQNTATRTEFLHHYVGSPSELLAYSTGVLARMRAMARGLGHNESPNHQPTEAANAASILGQAS